MQTSRSHADKEARRTAGLGRQLAHRAQVRSTVHGLTRVMNGNCVDKLDPRAGVLERAMRNVMDRIGLELDRAKG